MPAASVTASFFHVLRTPPRLGCPFTAEEDRPGAAPVVVLGDGLWRSRFGADPGIVGRVVEIDRERVEIVGVMPPGFAFPRPETALWRPMGLDPENVRLGFFGLNGVARTANGASLEQVRAELGAMLSNLEELLPDQPGAPAMAREFRPLIVPLRTWVIGDIEATLWILRGAVGFLLLIACANVANLFLVRAEARHGEVAIRAALGESCGRLVASVLIESLALGVAGGLAALLLAQGAVRLLVRFGPRELPRLEEISIDATHHRLRVDPAARRVPARLRRADHIHARSGSAARAAAVGAGPSRRRPGRVAGRCAAAAPGDPGRRRPRACLRRRTRHCGSAPRATAVLHA